MAAPSPPGLEAPSQYRSRWEPYLRRSTGRAPPAPTQPPDFTAAPRSQPQPEPGAGVRRAAGDVFPLPVRLSLDSHPWLADHAVMGTVLLPGTAFVELALRAGDQAG
ncbi:hypothetical protein, partial [Saccharothrix sp. ST-888]|uniref:hypothetical protein n=1 Tax=Saccharothrix sp. ST-888 TaxID=1427391 RepID=UPI003FA6A945